MTEWSSSSDRPAGRQGLVGLLLLARGRALAAVVTAAALEVQLAVADPLGTPWRRAWFDLLQGLFPRERPASAPPAALVVAVDERALARHGQWPWPRDLVGELLAAIAARGPAAIGVDILFVERDRMSPRSLADRLERGHPAAAAALRAVPDSDALLAAAVSRAPVALGVAGASEADGDEPGPPPPAPPVTVDDPAAGRDVARFPAALRSRSIIDRRAQGHGALTAGDSPDGVVRRVPLVQRIAGDLYLHLSVETLRLAEGAFLASVAGGEAGASGVRVGDILVPTARDGSFLVRYRRYDPSAHLSAADVLAGTFDPARVRGRIVLVGLTGTGLVDQRMTALGETVPGVEIHAQVVEQIVGRNHLSAPAWMRWAEAAVGVALAGLLILAAPRLSPGRAILAAGGAVLTVAVASVAGFAAGGLVSDGAGVALATAAVGAVTVAVRSVEAERDRRGAAAALQRHREATARLEGELQAARTIQTSLLPPPAHTGDPRVDLAAGIAPARAVGGDFYDYLMLDDRRLVAMVGDVSGKGVPASLFMALTKALWRSAVARSGPADVARAVEETNREVARDNAEAMFVTGVVVVLDLESGALSYVGAGHDMPALAAADGRVRALPGRAGLPLGLLSEAAYASEEARLEPGDRLCLTTDGIAEALAADDAAYGRTRLLRVLAGLGDDPSSSEAVDRVLGDVARHTRGAEQSDDITILALRWLGPSGPGPSRAG